MLIDDTIMYDMTRVLLIACLLSIIFFMWICTRFILIKIRKEKGGKK